MLCEIISHLHIYKTHMSPALNKSLALWHFEHGDAIDKCGGIIFDLYMGLGGSLSILWFMQPMLSWYNLWCLVHTSSHTHLSCSDYIPTHYSIITLGCTIS